MERGTKEHEPKEEAGRENAGALVWSSGYQEEIKSRGHLEKKGATTDYFSAERAEKAGEKVIKVNVNVGIKLPEGNLFFEPHHSLHNAVYQEQGEIASLVIAKLKEENPELVNDLSKFEGNKNKLWDMCKNTAIQGKEREKGENYDVGEAERLLKEMDDILEKYGYRNRGEYTHEREMLVDEFAKRGDKID
ncbi:hypothetical protein GW918_01535 [Candidatus Berkelbacteria bacterium]|nr:hypothetical protein [Candidatus Berkelbacteria bacterium]OIP05824.1 MAG: hypothetical protein AUK14_00985 [Candidatus Berkelbacteria bacterium CG2_30_39_44]PIR28247.1 MAG: hypothetical protein COV39_00015 [Candidatus Berkelbacteria bacterium CG11_big_fil_rev_8_21_14_0_20_40_23]PIX30799.1 MAG: hypothetical protein COZ62_00620 [Candidatus Berkelbacteria bacterium CG_4_8_14_3_um_filter_39_27]PIZ28494.1 MAG: hypothetical protein COY44_03720 [Candidatus Berkelbacteria bacterium CG_4_10_14_0_8_um